MADKYTKKAVEVPASPSPPADAWKDAQVEKEYHPAKAKTSMSYRSLEGKVSNIDDQIARLTAEKAEVEAEMVKVKAAAEA